MTGEECIGSSGGILALNERAATLMRRGAYAKSLAVLKGALATLMEELRRLEEDQVEDENEIACDKSSMQSGEGPSCLEVDAVPVCQGTTAGSDASSHCAIYDRALVLRGREDDVFSSPRHEELVVSVLLYNTALVHHMFAVEGTGPRQDQNYRKALRFYEMSKRSRHSSGTSFSDLHLFLAITNNQCHVHASQYCFSDAETSLGTLRSLLESFPAGADVSELQRDEIQQFILNVILMLDQHPSAPAA